MFAIDEGGHGFALLFLHELGDEVVFLGAVDEGGANVNLKAGEGVGIDSTTVSVATL